MVNNSNMKNKVVKLTESELTNIIKKVINEKKNTSDDNSGHRAYKECINCLDYVEKYMYYCETMEDVKESYDELDECVEFIRSQKSLTPEMLEELQQYVMEIESDLESIEETIEEYDDNEEM